MAMETMTDQEFQAAVDAMSQAGRFAGRSVATWLFDGNTTEETYRAFLKASEDGDPDNYAPPDPFSGEWADSLTLEQVIEAETDIDPETLSDDERCSLADAYEQEFCQAWWDEAERAARAAIGE